MQKKTPLIEIQNLSKRFSPGGPLVLENINATISEGEIVGLVGPDGAGKTTLIRLIASLLLPSHGKITMKRKDTVNNPHIVHNNCGYMPQKFGLYEDLTVQENLNLYADLKDVVEQREETFIKLLEFTGLAPFTDRLAKKLSGGMKQKLGLACALLKKPQLLLLDEPTVGVDPISRRELWTMVSSLLKEGISVLWSTAYLEEAEKCDTVLLLNEGKMLYNGDPKELIRRMEGRVFLINTESQKKKALLSTYLEKDEVIDCTVQAKDLRLVLKNKKAFSGCTPQKPRFEDAFIEILGGAPKGRSKLALSYPEYKLSDAPTVQAENLTKKFGSFTAVDNVQLNIRPGTIFGILGANGAGKTTTFRMLCGLLRPTFGNAIVAGFDQLKAPSQARTQIGYMAQKFSLYTNLSTLQNLYFFAGIYGLSNTKRKQAIDTVIDIFHLHSYLNDSTELLPLGVKQRLSLACATMHTPKVLFLDEPTSGVDPIMRREFWGHIIGLVEKGVTVLVTTHFMDEAEYCDEIALVSKGRIIKQAPPEELKASTKTDLNPNPSLEEAFITLLKEHEQKMDAT
jgi:ABC-2 type transport system ATP-binding protein